jgi:hypothetical protein
MSAVGLTWDSIRIRRRRRRLTGPPPRLQMSAALWVAAAASAGAAGIHLRVLPEHAAESAWYGAFFAGAAAAQLAGAAVLVARRSRALVMCVAAGNAAIVALWLVTRLVTIPLGPSAGTVESFGVLDVTAGVLESVIVVAALVAVLRRRSSAAARMPDQTLAKVA